MCTSLACWMVCMGGMVLLYTFLEHHYVDYVITYIMSLHMLCHCVVKASSILVIS